MAVTFLLWGSQLSDTVPDGWLVSGTLIGTTAAVVVVEAGDVEVDDWVELEPQAATVAAHPC